MKEYKAGRMLVSIIGVHPVHRESECASRQPAKVVEARGEGQNAVLVQIASGHIVRMLSLCRLRQAISSDTEGGHLPHVCHVCHYRHVRMHLARSPR